MGCDSNLRPCANYCDIIYNDFLLGRQKWLEEEQKAVEHHLKVHLKLRKTPGKNACDDCLKQAGDVLNGRSWKDVKYYVYNKNKRR